MIGSSPTVALRLSPPLRYPAKPCAITVSSLRFGVEEIANIFHNKVLVSATVASAIGQAVKPFTSTSSSPRDFDMAHTTRSGGMPSTHSAAVVAAATSLGLESGFSDPIFGMSVVIAAIVMYDSQGVRREVGRHAEVINTTLKIQSEANTTQDEDEDEELLVDSRPGMLVESTKIPLSLLSLFDKPFSPIRGEVHSSPVRVPNSIAECEKSSGRFTRSLGALNESVGHTPDQVLAGALLGFVVSLIAANTL